jgi:hypothetical protein
MFDQGVVKPDEEHGEEDLADPVKQALIYGALGLGGGALIGKGIGSVYHGTQTGAWLGGLGGATYGYLHQKARNKRALRELLSPRQLAQLEKTSGIIGPWSTLANKPGMADVPYAGPLLNTAALMAIPGAAGYALGAGADKLLDTTEEENEVGRSWRKRLMKLGLIGGGIAALPNAAMLYAQMNKLPEKKAEFQPTSRMAPDCSATTAIPQPMKKQSDWYDPNSPQGYSKSDSFAPSYFTQPWPSPLPVQEMARTVINDPYLPMGERMQFNTIVAGAQRRSPWEGVVTWPDVTRAAVGAGAGYLSARLLGKVCDGLFGKLNDSTQSSLNKIGVIGGILSATGALK